MPPPKKHTLLHPLSGADPTTFVRQWLRNFPFTLRTSHIRLLAVFAILVRSPKIVAFFGPAY